MEGFSPKLPLTRDKTQGFFLMNLTAMDSIKQDLKMLIMTSPGERVMLPEYGVGIRRVLFEQNSELTKSSLIKTIQNQINIYMNFLIVKDIQVSENKEDENALNLSIFYTVPSINLEEELVLTLSR